MVSFENFAKLMPPSLSELKVTPSFFFPSKISDNPTANSIDKSFPWKFADVSKGWSRIQNSNSKFFGPIVFIFKVGNRVNGATLMMMMFVDKNQ